MINTNSMYVHIPFCQNICTYCDFTKLFYSIAYEEKYLSALFKEIKEENPNKCKTIYIGGGTPSVLTEKGLDSLLSFLSSYLSEDYQEFSIEVNPETINEEKIALFKKYNINRVSIGIQSFNPAILTLLGRKHTITDIKKCVELLKKHELNNYSFDLMYGISGMSVSCVKKDLKQAFKFEPKHISYYSLILEDNTCLKAKKYQELDENMVVKQHKCLQKILKRNGYIQYEVSNYCKNGYESCHNLVYWENKEYYGFGLGASGYVNGVRYINTKNLTKYLNGILERQSEPVDNQDLQIEYIMLGLRLNKGISLSEYNEKFNLDLESQKKEEIAQLKKQGLIKIVDDRLFTTEKGMLLLNIVTLKLI